MALSVQFVYDTPQREVASLLSGSYQACTSAALVAGFMTVEGIDAILQPIRTDPSKLRTLLIGAGTWRAFDAFDQLLALGVPPDRLRVHLGHSRPTGAAAKKFTFYRYHPMLHSKVYLFDLPGGKATAFVGSHNLTGFALCGLNGEAGVRLDGDGISAPFPDVRTHINAAIAESVQYDPSQRDAYAWWAGQFMEGFAAKFDDYPREGEAQKTIIILAQDGEGIPSSGDVIYFELPAAIGKVQSLRAEVHIYLFDTLPQSPFQALGQLGQARASLWCRTIGVEDDRGGKELEAAWHIEGNRPVLRRAPRPFRPKPASDMQQVRVKAYQEVRGDFEYLFEAARPAFEPIFDRKQELRPTGGFAERLEALKLIPPEHLPWFRVTGLRRKEEQGAEDPYHMALRKLTPAEGSFIVMSVRRRTRAE